MGWLDNIAQNIENAVEETVTDVGKIIDRAIGLDDK